MQDLSFETPVLVQKQITANTFTILEAVDNPQDKRVIVKVKINNEIFNRFILWSGDQYDAVGQWTDADLVAATKQAIVNFYNQQTTAP